ncbi:MAG: FlgD immunoglobulin-like domain containing protein [Calditrichia bacterium]
MKKILLLLIIVLLSSSDTFAQLRLKRDDFVGTSRKNWWHWHNDGPSTPMPQVKDGYSYFSLVDADKNYRPYCDAAIWDGWPDHAGPWHYCEVTLRAKCITPHQYGSRGWGLWFTEDPPKVQKNAWFMQLLDDPDLTGIDSWKAETAKGRYLANNHFTDLTVEPHVIDIMQWHTYKIVWQPDLVEMFVDGNSVFRSTIDIPDQPMALHIWADNIVYQHIDPDTIKLNWRGWTGQNDFYLDYARVLSKGTLDSSLTPAGVMLLEEHPNEMGGGGVQYSWKNYSFNAPDGEAVILLTGRVEQYLDDTGQPISDDDDIRLVIDGMDYGWETATSLNGDAAGTQTKNLLIEQNFSQGNKNIDIYGDVTPLLSDVTVLGSPGGGVVFNEEYQETATGGATSYLWKDIDFLTHAGEVAIYISGSADEDPTPSPADHYGYQYSDYSDEECDHLKIVLDGYDYGYETDYALYGNRLFGEPKSILIRENLDRGSHNLKIYARNTPTLHRVLIYGEFDDVTLPVSLAAFDVKAETDRNLLTWRTESELENLGFNIYKAASPTDLPEDQLQFFKLNPQLIQGAGNSNEIHDYSYEDQHVQEGWYYWYYLEDVDFGGKREKHEMVKMYREESLISGFKLFANYPNPFNNSTKIRYKLPEAADVSWQIFSTEGRLVAGNSMNRLEKGEYAIEWNGTDANNLPVASGVYYFRLKANQFIKTIPMVLVQ